MTFSLHDRQFQGWAGSLGFHVMLLLLFLVAGVKTGPPMQEFAEVLLLPAPPMPAGRTSESQPGLPAAAAPQPRETSSVVDLPTRPRAQTPPERTIPVPPRRDTQVNAVDPSKMLDQVNRSGLRRPDTQVGLPEGEKVTPPLTGAGEGKLLPEGSVTGAGRDQPFQIQWIGTSRDLLSSVLPTVPEGIERDVELRYRFGVTPAGAVTDIRPLEKGDPILEESALAALRRWKFQPLPAVSPQVTQEAIITFRFRIR